MHWGTFLQAVRDDALPTMLGPQISRSPTLAADVPTEWVALLWLESREGEAAAVHLVGDGGVRHVMPQSPTMSGIPEAPAPTFFLFKSPLPR